MSFQQLEVAHELLCNVQKSCCLHIMSDIMLCSLHNSERLQLVLRTGPYVSFCFPKLLCLQGSST